jgi:hypothetical protein
VIGGQFICWVRVIKLFGISRLLGGTNQQIFSHKIRLDFPGRCVAGCAWEIHLLLNFLGIGRNPLSFILLKQKKSIDLRSFYEYGF